MRRTPAKNQEMTDQRQAPRRRLTLLIASGAVAAVAVTWGGFAAVGTLAPPEALSAPAATSASPGSDGTADAAGTPSSGSSSGSPSGSLPDSTSGTPSDPPSVGETAPPQGAGQHEGHGLGGVDPAGLPGSGLPGAPLTGEEPSASSASAPRPGTQQELSLEAAAAQPVPAAAGTGASDPAGGGDRTAGLTPRAPIDPAEVTGGLAALGGCLPEYGANGQCLPVVPPSMAEHAQLMVESGISLDTMHHPWSCSEVRQIFADGLTVRQAGVDPQRLDTNGDGTACGIGD